MRIVETVAVRTVLVISSLGLAAALAAWATQPEPVARVRQPVRPMRGCVKSAPTVAPPSVAPTTRTQVEVVQALRADLARCGEGAVDGSLSIYIDGDGTVRDVKLSGLLGARPEAMAACVKALVRPTRFPASDTDTAVEMLLRSKE